MDSVIELKEVTKTFKSSLLFSNVNITFEKGYIYGIIGNNGSGKSVLFKMICGFIYPDSGEITINPVYREKNSSFPKSFGVIIDRPGYIENMTGFENLKRLAMIQNKITDEQIKSTMIKIGLDPSLKQKVKKYSLGMKQKLSIIQAIMEDQEVLILDEPFNALDSESVNRVRDILIECKQKGKTILLTSHNKEDIDILCDKVYEIKDNKIKCSKL